MHSYLIIFLIVAAMAAVPRKYALISAATAGSKIGLLSMSVRYYVFLGLLLYIAYAHATMH